MWSCPRCGRTFANRNQSHTCARLGDLDAHFTGCEPRVREIFDAVLATLEPAGPFEVLAEKSRIALHVRMSFAAFVPRKRWLRGHLVLAREVRSDRFTRVTTFSPRNVLHEFVLTSLDEVDDEFADLMLEAYRVGEQRHLPKPPPTGRPDQEGGPDRGGR